MKIYQYDNEPADLPQILQRSELQDRIITDIQFARRYDELENDLGPLIEITVKGELVPQQVIIPMVTERLEAAELMIDLLLDTQQETP
jgi:hypothetical protein